MKNFKIATLAISMAAILLLEELGSGPHKPSTMGSGLASTMGSGLAL